MMSTQQSLPEGSPPERLSRDSVFSILRNRRRRYALYYLTRRQETVSLSDLAERIAAWENDLPVAEVNYKQRKRVYTSLHQTHLPKLDEADVIDYDRDCGTISLAERSADFDVYMEIVEEDDIPWCDFYLALSSVAFLLVVGAWIGVVPASLVSNLAVAGTIVGLFGISAGVHAYLTRHGRIGGDGRSADLPGER
jgi:hypothetical protein